jgi:hypothetical protein
LFVNGLQFVTPKLHHRWSKAGAKGAPRKAREILSVFRQSGNTAPPTKFSTRPALIKVSAFQPGKSGAKGAPKQAREPRS